MALYAAASARGHASWPAIGFIPTAWRAGRWRCTGEPCGAAPSATLAANCQRSNLSKDLVRKQQLMHGFGIEPVARARDMGKPARHAACLERRVPLEAIDTGTRDDDQQPVGTRRWMGPQINSAEIFQEIRVDGHTDELHLARHELFGARAQSIAHPSSLDRFEFLQVCRAAEYRVPQNERLDVLSPHRFEGGQRGAEPEADEGYARDGRPPLD